MSSRATLNLERASAPEAEVRLLNPQGIERSVLRTALYPGLLAAARTNRAAERCGAFRSWTGLWVRRKRWREGALRRCLYADPWIAGGWLTRTSRRTSSHSKGVLEKLAEFVGGSRFVWSLNAIRRLHPGVERSRVLE